MSDKAETSWYADLNYRQRKVVEAYVTNGNKKTQAVKTAGYGTPSVQSTRLFKLDKILLAIERYTEECPPDLIEPEEPKVTKATKVATPPKEPAEVHWHSDLNKRQKETVEAFATNGGQKGASAESAGYACPNAHATRLFKQPNILDALENLNQEETALPIATREQRQHWWTLVMYGKIKAEYIDDEGNRRFRPLKFKERLDASKLLGSSQGDFLDRQEHKHKHEHTVVELPESSERSAEILDILLSSGAISSEDTENVH